MPSFGLKTGVCLALMCSLAPIMAGAAANAEDAEQSYKGMIDYLTKDGGLWVQTNEKYAEGGDAAKYWIQAFRSGPGELSLIRDAYAVSDTDICTHLGHSATGWDANEKIAKLFGVSPGIIAEGQYQFPKPGEWRLFLSLTFLDGALLEMKDVTDYSQADVQRVQSARMQDGEWVASDAVEWSLSDGDNPCRN